MGRTISSNFKKEKNPRQEARERETNDNGPILEERPKSVDMKQIWDTYFADFIDRLNHRPRKRLGWRTSYELSFDKVLLLI